MRGDFPAERQDDGLPSSLTAAQQALAWEGEALRARFPDAVREAFLAAGVPTFTIEAPYLEAVARFLKEQRSYLMPLCASGVDRHEQLEVVYHIMSLETHRIVALKTLLPREAPRAPSLAAIWRGMDWHEREIFDLFGIRFDGHPDLRRILLPDDWEGHPLRKDYTEID